MPPVKYGCEYGAPTVPDGRLGPSATNGGRIVNVDAFEVVACVEALGVASSRLPVTDCRVAAPKFGGVSVTVTCTRSGTVTRVSNRLFGMLTTIWLAVTVVGLSVAVVLVSGSYHVTLMV